MQTNLGEYIIRKSTGFLGDFQMPVCARIISTEGANNQWGIWLTEDGIRRILRRYKEHAVFWKMTDNIVTNDLLLFANALQSIGSSFHTELIIQLYNALPAQRARSDEQA